MNGFQLVSSLVSSLVWPVLVGFVVFLFRTPLGQVIRHVRTAKGPGGWELEFDKAAKEAEATSSELLEKSVTLTGKMQVPLEETAHPIPEVVAPRVAVIEAFMGIEHEISRLASPYGRPRNTLRAARTLAEGNVIPEAVVPLIADLSSMRNQAAHESDFNPTPDSVQWYMEAADNVQKLLKAIRTSPTAKPKDPT